MGSTFVKRHRRCVKVYAADLFRPVPRVVWDFFQLPSLCNRRHSLLMPIFQDDDANFSFSIHLSDSAIHIPLEFLLLTVTACFHPVCVKQLIIWNNLSIFTSLGSFSVPSQNKKQYSGTEQVTLALAMFTHPSYYFTNINIAQTIAINTTHLWCFIFKML